MRNQPQNNMEFPQPQLPKREIESASIKSIPIESHRLTPHAQLQLSHTTSIHERLAQVNKLFETHPILGQKTARIRALAADRPIENKEHIAHLAEILLNQEKPLWQSVRIHAQTIRAHSVEINAREENSLALDEEQKKHIQEHAAVVKKFSGKEFDALCEYALISKEKSYESIKQDYQRFMAAAGAAQQLATMSELLDQQHFMLRKLDARLNLDAHRISPLIADLKLSLADQQTLAARLPQFSFK